MKTKKPSRVFVYTDDVSSGSQRMGINKIKDAVWDDDLDKDDFYRVDALEKGESCELNWKGARATIKRVV